MAHDHILIQQSGAAAAVKLTAMQQDDSVPPGEVVAEFTYTFENFFHPFVGELISKVNQPSSMKGIMDANWQAGLLKDFFAKLYSPAGNAPMVSFPKEIDVSTNGPYANYNWELFFHIPLTVAVHLSKTQRFAEAQRWFHYIFDPTSHDPNVDPPKSQFWKFLAFRQKDTLMDIDEVLWLLSTPPTQLKSKDQKRWTEALAGYNAILKSPFHPHKVAQTRPIAYQYSVVMKYLDNLIAWGDQLFQQDTLESINEATQLYVFAANILGDRPQKVPARGKVRANTFADLKSRGPGPIGDAFVKMEGQFPLDSAALPSGNGQGADQSESLFGIGRTLYFCLPRNEKLLSYWDSVGDRLFKVRHGMNIEGVVRPLALFEPPIDPGMLVKAAAAGIDIGSIVSGLNQPIGPVRCLPLIQKALELCGEVRSLGGALLTALEKGDAEHLARVRQRHEIQIQTMTQDIRFLQWKSAQEATTSVVRSRATALERLHYYQRLLGLSGDKNAPDSLPIIDRRELTEETFDEAYGTLVDQYDKLIGLLPYPNLRLAGGTSPRQQSGASGSGALYLNTNEDAELNRHSSDASEARKKAAGAEGLASSLAMIPNASALTAPFGGGTMSELTGGAFLADAGRAVGSLFNLQALDAEHDGQYASKTASYQRRADEWLLQYNLAAHELMQIGRQILTSLIAEQIALHEYKSIKQQITNAQEVDQFLHDKFTNEDLYVWMHGEISRLYYEYYRFAFDTARKAEKTMKQELMRPELDMQDFVKFNYWDGGWKGLLSGEALHLDVKRMEMAYHENNKRELELTRHVSLRQLSPIALLKLKATGSCIVTIPEWLYDRDCPGHYMRRIKSVALSIPSVAGPYTSVNCTLSLLRSSLRKSPLPKEGGYARQGSEDDRFIDYIGAIQSIVTSTGQNDGGMFETNLRDERFLPFEGAGAESTWKLQLADPKKGYPAFDYATISDVILHIRYTARQGVDPTKVKTALEELFGLSDSPQSASVGLAMLLSLRHEFPTDWSAFVNGTGDFSTTVRKEFFPYFTQGRTITITGLDLYDGTNVTNHKAVDDPALTVPFKLLEGKFTLSAERAKVSALNVNGDVFLIVSYSL
jgi:hypothetical protein